MLSNNKSNYNSNFKVLEEIIEEISIILLTKQELKQQKLNELYQCLIETSKILNDEVLITKELTSLLFKFYKMAESEMQFVKDKEGHLKLFIAYLQKYIGKIFGE